MKFLIPLLLLHCGIFSGNSQADRPSLRWAADAESGAPYVFHDPKDPDALIGFEVDLIKAVAEQLNREPVFVQNAWEALIPGLKTGTYDVVINGIEITDDRKKEVAFSIPYYVTAEQIVVRKDGMGATSLQDLKGKTVGTLKSSLAHTILEETGGMEIRTYEEETNFFSDLEYGRIEAVFIDIPVALYYAKHNPKFKFTGPPIGHMEYGIAVKAGNRQLQVQINDALTQLTQSGKLRQIMEDWGLWDESMAKAFNDYRPVLHAPRQYERHLESLGISTGFSAKLKIYYSLLPKLGFAALLTLQISVLSMMIAMSVGLCLALLRLYAPRPIALIVQGYVEFVRGTPLLIQLFFIFYGLPNIGIQLNPFTAALLGLGLNYAAYESENYRAGILSIPRAQMEAALALGMSPFQALRHVILPQALRVVIPPVTNDFISLLKDSSLVSVLTLVELTKMYGQLASTYYDHFGLGLIVAAVYFLIGLPFIRLSRTLEKRLAVQKRAPKGTISLS